MEEQSPPQQHFEARGLGAILNETFVIYGRHFKKFAVLVAVIHLPATAVTLIPSDNLVVAMILNIISLTALTFAYGAAIFAVGQHYINDHVSVSGCYTRVLWRGVSFLVLAAIQAVLVGSVLILVQVNSLFLLPLTLVMVGGMLLYLIYMTTAAPAVIVEGYRSIGALKRGIALARTAEFRILGYVMVYGLVASGLVIVVLIPFLIFAALTSGETEVTPVGSVAIMAGSFVASVLVPPVTYIPMTLLYYDLRVRKEGYDVSQLSRELRGVAA